MSEVLLTHADIYTDERKVYLDGSILIDDGKIIDIYHGVKKNYEGKIIDLKGNMIIPSFFSLNEKGDVQKGVSDYLRVDHMDDHALGLFKYVTEDSDLKDVKVALVDRDMILDDDIKVVLGMADIKDIARYHFDAIGPLYKDMGVLDMYHPNIIAQALFSDHYVILDTDGLDEEVIKFTLRNKDHDKVIIESDDMLGVLKLDIPMSDLIGYLDINAHAFLGHGHRYGRLMKGNEASFIILDQKRNYLFSFIRGKIWK